MEDERMPELEIEEPESAETVTEESGFEDAFNKAAGGREEEPAVEEPDKEEETSSPGEEPGSADPLPSTEEEPGDTPNEEKDPWDGASPEALAERDKLLEDMERIKHTAKSDAGRVAALQRQMAGQGTRLSTSELAAAISDPEKFEELREDEPDIAEAVSSLLDARTEKVKAEILGEIAPLKEAVAQRSAKDELELLGAPVDDGGFGHEDWQEVAAKPEFAEWLDKQDAEIGAYANSPLAADAAIVFDKFKAETVKSPPEDPETPSEKSEAQSVAERRKKQLDDSVGVSSKGSRVARTGDNSSPGDFESIFNAVAKSRDKT